MPARKFLEKLLVALLAAFVVFLFSSSSLHDFIERKTLDYRFTVRDSLKTPAPESPVLIVGIDKKSLDRFTDPIALNDALMEAVVLVSDAGAKTVGFDVLHLTAVDPSKCRYEKGAFLGAIMASEGTVVPYHLMRRDVGMPTYVADLMAQIMGLDEADIRAFPQKAKLKLLDAAEEMLPARFGYANLAVDRDGVVRGVRLVEDYGGALLPGFATAIYLQYSGVETKDVKLTKTGIRAGDKLIPHENGRTLINYAAPPGLYPHVSLADVIERKDDAAFLRDTFAGKIALIGAYDLRIPDFHATPYYASSIGKTHNMFGVEIAANVLDTLINGRFIRRESRGAAAALLLAACLIPVFSLVRLPLWKSLPLLAALMLGWSGLAQAVFARQYLWLGVVSIEAALPFAFLVGHLHNTFILDRDRRFIRRVLGSYLDPRIVRDLAERGDASLLGGRRREVTVLFSDIRGFTTLSERLEPEQVVEVLNVHLSAMSDVIMGTGGMVDKYVGDAVMAVWNAPNDVADHRLLACETALKMQAAIKEVNAEIARRGIELPGELRIGIGVNTGHAVVGNIGSAQKSDYTAIGDAVNVAARLESLNKEQGTTIIVSDTACEGLGDKLNLKDLGEVNVKGREEAVRIFELRGKGNS